MNPVFLERARTHYNEKAFRARSDALALCTIASDPRMHDHAWRALRNIARGLLNRADWYDRVARRARTFLITTSNKGQKWQD